MRCDMSYPSVMVQQHARITKVSSVQDHMINAPIPPRFSQAADVSIHSTVKGLQITTLAHDLNGHEPWHHIWNHPNQLWISVNRLFEATPFTHRGLKKLYRLTFVYMWLHQL